MRINRLTVKNFRRFEETTFEFHRQFTILVGDNGTGKTAVLDALRIGVGAYLLGVPDMKAPSIRREYVRRETRRNGEFSTFEPVTPSEVLCEGSVHEKEFLWHRELTSLGGKTTRMGVRDLRDCVVRRVRESEPNTIFPLILSYDTGRLWIEPRMTKQIRLGNSLASRQGITVRSLSRLPRSGDIIGVSAPLDQEDGVDRHS